MAAPRPPNITDEEWARIQAAYRPTGPLLSRLRPVQDVVNETGLTARTPEGYKLAVDPTTQTAHLQKTQGWGDFALKSALTAGAAFGGQALMGVGGAGSVAASVPAATAATAVAPAASSALASSLPYIISGVAGVATTALGIRAQSQAAREAAALEREGINAQLAYAREQDILERDERAAANALAQQRWEAEQRFQQDQWRASEDDRLLRRQWDVEDRQYEVSERTRRAEERAAAEAARANYIAPPPAPPDPRVTARQALQSNALANLGQLLNMGTPGYNAPVPQPPTSQGFSLGAVMPSAGTPGYAAPTNAFSLASVMPSAPVVAPLPMHPETLRQLELARLQGRA